MYVYQKTLKPLSIINDYRTINAYYPGFTISYYASDRKYISIPGVFGYLCTFSNFYLHFEFLYAKRCSSFSVCVSVFMHKYVNNKLPNSFSNKFVKLSNFDYSVSFQLEVVKKVVPKNISSFFNAKTLGQPTTRAEASSIP